MSYEEFVTTNARIDDVRLALSANFDNVVRCLLPMVYADQWSWTKEEEFLNNFASAAKMSAAIAQDLLLSTAKSKYSLAIFSEKVHKRVWVDFLQHHRLRSCEIGDILIVSKYVESRSILSRNVCFLQVKASDKSKRPDTWKIDRSQLNLYVNWPTIQNCYIGHGLTKTALSQNVKINHRNRLFSPYLLIGRNWQPGLRWGPSSWITGPDLVATASQANRKMSGPLELPLLFYLIQMLFQATGERDMVSNKVKNANLKRLVDSLLRYVNLNDPPKGEGRPFVVLTLAVKKIIEPQ